MLTGAAYENMRRASKSQAELRKEEKASKRKKKDEAAVQPQEEVQQNTSSSTPSSTSNEPLPMDEVVKKQNTKGEDGKVEEKSTASEQEGSTRGTKNTGTGSGSGIGSGMGSGTGADKRTGKGT